MFMRTVSFSLVVIAFGANAPAWGGYYSTTDTLEELRYSLDYERVFRPTLDNLVSIAIPPGKAERETPIRRRYLMMEALVGSGALKLDKLTLEQKLNYSTVLIRRGKADEAVEMLLKVVDEYPENFLVLSHCASAHFLASNDDFRRNSKVYMKRALQHWPDRWTDLKEEHQTLLYAFGWEATAYERYRRYEVFFKRLIDSRLDEERRRARKEVVPEAVDPIFTEPKDKPIRFLNEKDAYEVGRIAHADKERMPPDAVEAVQQLLIWMPSDQRLLWLLAETFNASAMEEKRDELKNAKIRSALYVFQKLNNPLDRAKYGTREIHEHAEALAEYVGKLKDENIIPPLPEEKASPWWRIGVGFATGLAIGMFLLWQVQEWRRRRHTRAMVKH